MRPTPRAAAAALRRRLGCIPSVAVVLGSGFGAVLNALEVQQRIAFNQIPGFPRSKVPGHRGELIMATVASQPVLFLAGRSHYYEGLEMAEVTFPTRALAAAGVSTLLLTNAAGGISPKLKRGDFMVVTDHINLMGCNPLRGPEAGSGSEFLDLSRVYDPEWSRLLRSAGRSLKIRCKAGVYAAVSGPSYETPAEIRAFGRLGADAVGMSTVPEAIVARRCGMRVAAVSLITNLAAGRAPTSISHEEVLKESALAQDRMAGLIICFLRMLLSIECRCGDCAA